ncbi:hypothetical protein ACTD5D_21170 [Nocardia takedensis]|uniref:hypothetical protein n=1 Tax=Nocardia takedensis TaxID=259390 RepID=UPI003F76B6B3
MKTTALRELSGSEPVITEDPIVSRHVLSPQEPLTTVARTVTILPLRPTSTQFATHGLLGMSIRARNGTSELTSNVPG